MSWYHVNLAVWFAIFGHSGMLPAADGRPNILLIVSEDNGPELGCYGDPYARTPVIDQLAEEGVRFENAFVPQAGCSQSRAALLTGLYPHQNGQIGLATWKFRMYHQDTPNLVQRLKRAGYRTGLIGKLHVNPKDAFPFDQHEIATSNFSRKRLDDYARFAEKFFNLDDTPFFLSVNYPDAHRPFTADVNGLPENPLTQADVKPLPYFGLDTPELRQQTADYYNCLSRLDSLIGDLLAALDRSGRAENTLIVYLGDHGADLLRGKRTSYEGGLRIPLIIRWPGHLKSGQVRNELVSTIDLLPTFLSAANVAPINNLPGRSLQPLMRGERVEWRKYLFAEYHLHSAHNFFPQRTVRNARFKLIRNLQPNQLNPGYDFTLNRFFDGLDNVVNNAPAHIRQAYECMRRPPEFELYDLQEDPFEFHNLAGDTRHKGEFEELAKQLQAWREKTKDPVLNELSLHRLKTEIEACFIDGKPSKDGLKLTYPDYFFNTSHPDSSPQSHLDKPRAKPHDSDVPETKQHSRKPDETTGKLTAAAFPLNVLFVAIDDLRPALGCYNDPIAVTPNIDRLANRATVFTSAYCQLAVCSPSRLSLLTGRRPDDIQVWDLKTHFRHTYPDLVTLPQLFRQNGYHTQSIGKIFHGSGAPAKDPLSWSVPPLFDTAREADVRYALSVNLQGTGLKRAATEAAEVHDDRYLDGMVCAKAEETISGLASEHHPFFLAVGFRKPHLPFCAPQKYWDMYHRDQIPMPKFAKHPRDSPELATRSWKELEGYTDIHSEDMIRPSKVRELRHGYYACVSYVDALVGRLMQRLKQVGLAETTAVVLWGDHGYHLGEQGLWTKANNFELSTRVPLIISVPGITESRKMCTRLVELVDVYRTTAEICGLSVPSGVDGTSAMPLLTKPDLPWKTAVFSQFPRDRTSHRHNSHGDIMGYAIRTERFRYVEWRNWQTKQVAARELYDHSNDPFESRNVVSAPALETHVLRLATILQDQQAGHTVTH